MLADAVKVTLGPEGPQRRHREVLGRADRHQGRRHRRQGNPARGQVREHGRADGQGGRLQDFRRRRRRHHHRHRAGPGHLPRRCEDGRRRARPDGDQARHRQGGGAHRRRAQGALQADQGPRRDRPGRHHVRQRRRDHRRHHRRSDGQGRQGRRDHRRGSQEPGDHAGRRGRHAVRSRLPLALLRHRSGAHGSRPRGPVHPDSREEDQLHEGSAADPRADRQVGQAAADHRRGHRGRGAGHPGRQQDPRHAARRRRQGAGLRRPPQGHARGHRHPHRRPHDRRGARPQARERDAQGSRPRQADGDRQGQHAPSSTAPARRPTSRGASSRSAPRSRRRPPTTTARSCRSGSPSWSAALPSSASVQPPRSR